MNEIFKKSSRHPSIVNSEYSGDSGSSGPWLIAAGSHTSSARDIRHLAGPNDRLRGRLGRFVKVLLAFITGVEEVIQVRLRL